MKVLIKEDPAEGLAAFMGQGVTLWCGVYIYTGTLVGLNDTCVKLDPAFVVYETGELKGLGYKDAQAIDGPWYVMMQSIESFGKMKAK